jgi:hypothetical protein
MTFLLSALTIANTKSPAWRWYLVGIVMGFSVLVRFSGLFMLPLFGLWLLLENASNWSKFKYFLGYCLLAIVPFFVWSMRNNIAGGELSSREIFWQWAGNYPWLNAVNTLVFWLGISLPLVAVLVMGRRSWMQNRLHGLWLIYPAIYISFLVLAKSTVDREIPLDTRLLSALLPIGWLLLTVLWSKIENKPWHVYFWLLAGILNLGQFLRPAGQFYQQEMGLYPQLLAKDLATIESLPDTTAMVDSLYCRDFDFNYLRYFSRYPVVYGHELPDKPVYWIRFTAPLPVEFAAANWRLDTILADRLYYATPIDYP